jgi:hypothetical protein
LNDRRRGHILDFVIARSLLESFREIFLAYALDCNDYSPLYEHLSTAIANDPELLDFSTFARAGQPPPNLLFASVHYLLLRGCDHPLKHYFGSVTPQPRPPQHAWPAFRDFCLRHRPEIATLMSTRLVQTNEVGRSACLLPAFYVSRLAGGRPLALIDVGASAGLNLLFDRFFIDYGRFSWGDPDSPVRLSCELRGALDPPIARAGPSAEPEPAVGFRAGIDINPIDLMDEDAMLWLRALVWPEQPERAYNLHQAASIARAQALPIIKGDAIEVLPSLLESVPADLTLCLYHSFVLHQLASEARQRFDRILSALSLRREVYVVGMAGSMQAARLTLSTWSDGDKHTVQLAECMAHGKWLRWLAD